VEPEILFDLSFAFAQLLCSSGVSGVSGVSDISSGIASFQEWKEWKEWKTLVLKDSLFYGIYRV
jgi:hypothetical protein